MNWIQLKTDTQLDELIAESHKQPQVIFKYSNSCSLSDTVKEKLESSKIPSDIIFHFLDLIPLRALSNKIAENFGVRHQSPQVLLIIDGKCTYHSSHLSIRMDAIEAAAM